MLTPEDISRLLDDICANFGICLPPLEKELLSERPPQSVVAFTNAVLVLEGLNPALVDRHLYRQIRDHVRRAFENN